MLYRIKNEGDESWKVTLFWFTRLTVTNTLATMSENNMRIAKALLANLEEKKRRQAPSSEKLEEECHDRKHRDQAWQNSFDEEKKRQQALSPEELEEELRNISQRVNGFEY